MRILGGLLVLFFYFWLIQPGKFWGFMEEHELNIQRRMDIESADYSGAGANKNHDPRPPGSS